MEEEGILDPANELQLLILHLVFIPRIQNHLDRFAEALKNRPLRTEHNRTPMQLWLSGLINRNKDGDQVIVILLLKEI